jgi:polar amino acid transport system substrate-binding protein
MIRLAATFFGLLFSIYAMAQAAPADAVKDLAPNGRLRAAINFGNPVLAQRDPMTGGPRGVSVALARELARQLDVPVDFVPFAEAGQVVEALGAGGWDIAFLAIDPVRADSIGFTTPYLLIEGVYLVPAASPLQRIDDADRDGQRIGVAKGSAYDLFLTRTLTRAGIARAASSAEALDLLVQHKLDALAGVKQPLAQYARSHPDTRLIPGRFMEIDQAMAMPKGRPVGLRFLSGFVEAMKASGFVAHALAESGQGDVVVAPPSP